MEYLSMENLSIIDKFVNTRIITNVTFSGSVVFLIFHLFVVHVCYYCDSLTKPCLINTLKLRTEGPLVNGYFKKLKKTAHHGVRLFSIMAPLTCTNNTLWHFDYGTPLVANKSTDYRTSSGKNHRFIPSAAQEFDCRVKARIKPELLEKNIAIKDEWRSTHTTQYPRKPRETDTFLKYSRAQNCKEVDYVLNAQEKIFQHPSPNQIKVSEMKEKYQMNYWLPRQRPIDLNVKCEIPETFRPIQPDIRPEEKGYYKLLDIYLTENRAKYVPYSAKDLARAQEDFITFYNASGNWKGLKEELPGKLHGYSNVYDKAIFSKELPNRFLSRGPKRVPNFGMKTEYQGKFFNPACSNFFPYIQTNDTYFPESLSGPSPWQNLCPPAMYCSENCHIGTGWPVRAVVDVNGEGKSEIVHPPCCPGP